MQKKRIAVSRTLSSRQRDVCLSVGRTEGNALAPVAIFALAVSAGTSQAVGEAVLIRRTRRQWARRMDDGVPPL